MLALLPGVKHKSTEYWGYRCIEPQSLVFNEIPWGIFASPNRLLG
jgi:hypothetical protein